MADKKSYDENKLALTVAKRQLTRSLNKFDDMASMPDGLTLVSKFRIVAMVIESLSYAGVTGMKLSLVGQCTMYINFKTMKTTKNVRALW